MDTPNNAMSLKSGSGVVN